MQTTENLPVSYWVTLSEQDAEIFETIVSCFQDTNGKSLKPPEFIEFLVKTVIDIHKNPDSDSATMMDALLLSHFPNYVDNFEPLEKERESLLNQVWAFCEASQRISLTVSQLREMKLEHAQRAAELDEMLEEEKL